jgi:Arc/MetJ-type ribon-helix-helix transcriptional regulator
MTRRKRERVVFPPVRLDKDRRPTWSVNVDLPPEVDAEIRRYVEKDELTSWTVMIHGALYIYRWQFWTKEELGAELREAIEESIRSADEEGTIEITPQFWKDMKRRCRKNAERITELQGKGKMGNLLLPKELYEFVQERIGAGDCKTPTDVVCAAVPYLRRQRKKEQRGGHGPVAPKVLETVGNESRQHGTSTLSSKQIDEIVREARKTKRTRQTPGRLAKRNHA